MQNFILSERYKQIIICLLSKSDMNRYISSDQLASEIYLSRSTLVKDIKNLNKYLQYYNLQIKGVNKLG
ncbi:helix-turn-helix domain-containing protein, partial [uncultured Faecalicoccus sp.]